MNIPEYDSLQVDPVFECERITRFIKDKVEDLNRDGLIIGLSGGFDSTVVTYLASRSLPVEKIRLLYLPERDSKNKHKEDAQLVASILGIKLEVMDISEILDAAGVYDLLPLKFVPGKKLKDILVKIGKQIEKVSEVDLLSARLKPRGGSLLAKGNAYGTIKHRMRMVILYYEANIHNLMVVGAANKSELLTGTFSQWGCDQCADIMPIIHLYRSQLESLAEYLQVPEVIRLKPADPDIMPGVDNKEELLGSFRETDLILHGLENGLSINELNALFGFERVEKIHELFKFSEFMRQSPYSLG